MKNTTLKKIIAGTALLAAFTASADAFVWISNSKTNRIDCIEYATNAVAKKAKSQTANVWTIPDANVLRAAVTPSVRAEMDSILSGSKFYVTGLDNAKIFPKLYANQLKIFAGTAKEAMIPVLSPVVANPEIWDAHIRIAVCNAFETIVVNHHIDRNRILDVAPAAIKHKLREDGKSFVVRNKVNPIQELLTPIVNALNAYRLEGLNAALKAAGMDYGLDFEGQLYAEDYINSIKNKVLYGEKPIRSLEPLLRTHLGVDKYNEFVRTYNGEE